MVSKNDKIYGSIAIIISFLGCLFLYYNNNNKYPIFKFIIYTTLYAFFLSGILALLEVFSIEDGPNGGSISSPVSSPTSPPTKSPTQSPTFSPTSSPTASPIVQTFAPIPSSSSYIQSGVDGEFCVSTNNNAYIVDNPNCVPGELQNGKCLSGVFNNTIECASLCTQYNNICDGFNVYQNSGLNCRFFSGNNYNLTDTQDEDNYCLIRV